MSSGSNRIIPTEARTRHVFICSNARGLLPLMIPPLRVLSYPLTIISQLNELG